MASESELRTQVDAAIAAVLASIAAGKTVTEWREGAIHVKRDTPAELLRALRDMRAALSDDEQTGRCASVCITRGVV